MIGTRADGRNEPFGLTCRSAGPIRVPPVAGLLLINPRAGTESPTAEELAAAARVRGIEARILGDGRRPRSSSRARPRPTCSARPAATARVASVAAVAIERDLPFVVVPVRDAQPLRPRPRPRPDDPLAALEALRGRGAASRRRPRRRAALPEQRLARRLRDARPPARAPPAPAPAASPACARSWLSLRRGPGVWAKVDGEPVARPRPARREQRLRAEPVLDRRARAARRGAAAPLHRQGRAAARTGTSGAASASSSTRRAAAAGRVDGEPVELETPLELAIEPRALRVLAATPGEH